LTIPAGRVGASIDLKHDEADLDKTIACPLSVEPEALHHLHLRRAGGNPC